MDNNRILLFAQIANFAYNDDIVIAKKDFENLGYSIVKYLDNNGSQAYIIENKNEMIISFRGTELTQYSDIIADIDFIKEKDITDCGYIHKGFKKHLDLIWDDLLLVIKPNNKPLYITGHSLGASMSTIAASRLKSSISALITFGSPRVGDSKFVNNLDIIHYRIQNNNDIISRLPLEAMNFKHHGKCIYLNYNGIICELTNWQMFIDSIRSHLYALYNFKLFNGIHDHSIVNYINKFNKLTVG